VIDNSLKTGHQEQPSDMQRMMAMGFSEEESIKLLDIAARHMIDPVMLGKIALEDRKAKILRPKSISQFLRVAPVGKKIKKPHPPKRKWSPRRY